MLGITWQQIAAIVLGIICLVLLWFFRQGRHWISIAEKAKKDNDAEALKAANIYILNNISDLASASKSNWALLAVSILFGVAAIVALLI